jgi:hypothetical protein
MDLGFLKRSGSDRGSAGSVLSALMNFTRKNHVYSIVLVWAWWPLPSNSQTCAWSITTAWGSAIAVTLIDMITLACLQE